MRTSTFVTAMCILVLALSTDAALEGIIAAICGVTTPMCGVILGVVAGVLVVAAAWLSFDDGLCTPQAGAYLSITWLAVWWVEALC